MAKPQSLASRKPLAAVMNCSASDISFVASPSKSLLDAELDIVEHSPTSRALEAASNHLLQLKRPVAFPTETVYGLAAPALDPSVVSQIFSTKGRPADNPLIVHVSSRLMLQSLLPKGYSISPLYERLISAFWPGPLTLLFPADPAIVPSIVTANHPTVAIRMPSHPIARALIAYTGTPLAAPSANSSGRPSPTKADHVLNDLGAKLGVILDGGSCAVGLESTVVDGLNPDGNLRVLRPGGVTVEDLERVISEGGFPATVLVHKRDFSDENLEQAPTTPGMKYRHYSPSAPVILLMTTTPPTTQPLQSLKEVIESALESLPHYTSEKQPSLGFLLSSDSKLHQVLSHVPSQLQAKITTFDLGHTSTPLIAAQRLFDGFLTLDKEAVDLILIEGIKETKEGLAVMNRARKAATGAFYVSVDQ